MPAIAEIAELRRRQVADGALLAGQALEIVVVEHDRDAVGGDVQVAFDGVMRRDRGIESGERVLRPPRAGS